MSHVRFAVLTLAVFALTTASLAAEETPAAMEPLQIVEDCIQAAEAGDFARYVDHLSKDEQRLQAGYILYVTRAMSTAFDLGISITDPEMFLRVRTMRQLVKRHTVPESKRQSEYQAAETVLAQLTGEMPPAGPYPVGAQINHSRGERCKQCRKAAGVLSDARHFLVDALAELARPTSISGEQVPAAGTFFDVGEVIKQAKATKWTLYTRGDAAVAVAAKPNGPREPHSDDHNSGNAPPKTQPTIGFMRTDDEWKITRLLPPSVLEPGGA